MYMKPKHNRGSIIFLLKLLFQNTYLGKYCIVWTLGFGFMYRKNFFSMKNLGYVEEVN